MAMMPVHGNPVVLAHLAEENPIFAAVGGALIQSPFVVTDMQRMVKVIDTLRQSKKPSEIAGIPADRLTEIAREIDLKYEREMLYYVGELNRAIDRDLQIFERWAPDRITLIMAEVGIFTDMASSVPVLPPCISTFFLGLFGIAVGLYGRESTRTTLRNSRASRRRSECLIHIEHSERRRKRESIALLDRRLAAIETDIHANEQDGLLDQSLLDERNQLQAIKGVFTAPQAPALPAIPGDA